jgi:hypothetical protein
MPKSPSHRVRSSSLRSITGAVLACALAVSVTACSSSGGGTPPKPATKAQLAAMVLQPSEVPSGWTASVHKADATEAAQDAKFDKCLGARDTDPDKVAEAYSEDYTQTNGSISSDASSYKTSSDIDSDKAALTGSKAAGCFQDSLEAQIVSTLPKGSQYHDYGFKLTKGGPAGSPSNVVTYGALHMSIAAAGQNVDLYLNVAFIVGPLIEAEVDFEGIGAPLDAIIQAGVIKAVSDRVAAG